MVANYLRAGYKLPRKYIDSIKHLIEGETVHPSDGMHVGRVLWIQVKFALGRWETWPKVLLLTGRREIQVGVVEGTNLTGWKFCGCGDCSNRGGGGVRLVAGGLIRVDNTTIFVTDNV